jgi:acyl carrier protein
VPVGAPGELLIGGEGLARGYRNQPEQTVERFVADPVGGSGARVYRTGDVVRVLADGNIEFLTRVDGQIKIRGFRVELGEVETVLAEHAAIDRVAVVAQDDPRGDLRLVAYVVLATSGDYVDALRAYARTRLPEYMVPAAIVTLAALPLMANGKLDRSALPSPESVAAPEREYVEPSTDTERRLATIWADAMSLERVGAQDDFFELGGHSLLATQVIARIRNEFGVQLPLHSLFTAPRIADLAREVEALQGPAAATDDDGLAELLAELEGLSDEEATKLLGANDDRRPGD